MNHTVIGRHLYAMGGNEQAARLSGIRTDRLKWLAYCIGAMTAALAGVLYTAEVGQADPFTEGSGYELNAIAASVVGGCSLQGGIGTIPGVMLGVLFLRVVIDSVAKLVGSGADDYEGIIVGFLVVLAVTFNELRQRAPRAPAETVLSRRSGLVRDRHADAPGRLGRTGDDRHADGRRRNERHQCAGVDRPETFGNQDGPPELASQSKNSSELAGRAIADQLQHLLVQRVGCRRHDSSSRPFAFCHRRSSKRRRRLRES